MSKQRQWRVGDGSERDLYEGGCTVLCSEDGCGERGRVLLRLNCSFPYDANARLIAAAPELLEACQRAVADYESKREYELSPSTYQALRDAIQKATKSQ